MTAPRRAARDLGKGPVPEIATAGRRDASPGSWIVEPGPAARGEAWTSTVERRMRVPFDRSDLSRLVRAHEQMHARISPRFGDADVCMSYGGADTPAVFPTLDARALKVAEEYRVNECAGRVGFAMDDLTDGSERETGRRAATGGDWDGVVLTSAAFATSGRARGKAHTAFVRGLRDAAPDMDDADLCERMALAVKDLATRLAEYVRPRSTKVLADTTPVYVARCDCRASTLKIGAAKALPCRPWSPSGDTRCEVCGLAFAPMPRGYLHYTSALAQIIDDAMQHDPTARPPTPDPDDYTGDDLGEVETTAETSHGPVEWQPARVSRDMPTVPVRGKRLVKRRRTTDRGRYLRHPERLATDPMRRAFGSKARLRGGVVLLDLSSSVHYSNDDVVAMLDAAPGAIVLGYSAPDSGDVYHGDTVWVLAAHGKGVAERPRCSGGNGCDGTALRMAIAKASATRSPVVWVSDGIVTGRRGSFDALAADCLDLVTKHRVRCVATPEMAAAALRGTTPRRVYGFLAALVLRKREAKYAGMSVEAIWRGARRDLCGVGVPL